MFTLVIPTYNERGSLPELFLDISNVLRGVDYDVEVVVVDDSSDDGTAEWVLKNSGNQTFSVRCIERQEKGLSSAILRGIREARGDYVLVMDADLSHPASKIPEMMENLRVSDVVIGTRRTGGGGVEEWPLHRRLMSRSGELLSRVLGVNVSDPMSGFFGLRKSILKEVKIRPRGYKLLLDILVKTKTKSVREVPYLFRNRDVGESKLRAKVILDFFIQIVGLKIWSIFYKVRNL